MKSFFIISLIFFSANCEIENEIPKDENAYLHYIPSTEDIVVNTENGQVRGRLLTTLDKNRTYYAFQSIPYAQPPIGDLRFRSPLPPKNWNGILNATHDLVPCVQSSITGGKIVGSEDCLYLTVYTPKNPKKDSKLLPVMFSIHGGGFIGGVASLPYANPDYFIEQDVIVVVMHYRLGVFGFLSTGDLVSPGNYGLKDQVMALEWVQKNIEHFKGNPNMVTIFGESAGAASVSYQLVSKKSKGLYQRAIMESGTALCLWSLSRRSVEAAYLIGERLQLSLKSNVDLVNDLKKVDYKSLQTAAAFIDKLLIIQSNLKNGLNFGPVKEIPHADAFFDERSYDLLEKGQFNQVPSIIGFNSMEAGTNITLIMRLYLERYDINFARLVPTDLNIRNKIIKFDVGMKIKHRYFGLIPVSLQTEAVIRFVSDDQFVRPIRETVNLHSKYAPVYYYRFSYMGTLGGVKHRVIPGAVHAEELPYLWRSSNNATGNDLLISARMVKMWTNFAKYGEPTPKPDALFDNVNWPVANAKPQGLAFLDIDHKLTVQMNPQSEVIDYWNSIYQAKGYRPFDTY